MSKSNEVRLIGRFSAKPELKQINTDTSVSTFQFATNDVKKNADGSKTPLTEWHNVVAFNSQAKLVNQYCDKGDLASITGRLRTRQYEDKNGNSHYVTEIILEDILFLSNKKS
jgi:single-strand DNA-binding protein